MLFFNDVQFFPESISAAIFLGSTTKASALKDNRLHLSVLSFAAGGVNEAALGGVKQKHQGQKAARLEHILIQSFVVETILIPCVMLLDVASVRDII